VARRGSLALYKAQGEITATIHGRGVTSTVDGAVSVLPSAGLYTRHYGYNGSGDQTSESTPPITTTSVRGTLLANLPVTSTDGDDGDGNRTSLTSPNGYTTTYRYDHLGRLVQTTQYTTSLYGGSTQAPVQTTQYDGEGNVVQTVDGNGDVTLSADDPLGRVISTTDPVGATTLYTYSATAKQAEQDGTGNVSTYSYDAAGRLRTTTDPLQGTTQYQNDSVGNTTVITAPGGSPIEFKGYDGLNELITDTVAGPLGLAGPLTTTLTAYDFTGNVAQTQAPNGDTTYDTHDGAHRLVAMSLVTAQEGLTGTASALTQYTYDDADNLIDTGDLSGNEQTTSYDGANRAQQTLAVNYGTGAMVTTTAQYDPDGNVLTTTTQAGDAPVLTDTAQYNPLDWPITSTNTFTPNTPPQAFAYQYDGAGQQRVQAVAFVPSLALTATLDAAGQQRVLTDTVFPTLPITAGWSYNANGLPLTETVAATVVTQTQGYDGNSQLITETAQTPLTGSAPLSQTYQYGYLPVGWTSGLTTTISGTTSVVQSVQTYTHDSLGRLVGAQGPTTGSWSYDGDGNQTTGTSPNGMTTTLTYDHLGRVQQAYQPQVTLANGALATPVAAVFYDHNGNLTFSQDVAGGLTLAVYDPLSRTVELITPVQSVNMLTYTATALAPVRDSLGNVTAHGYDLTGRLIAIIDLLQVTTRHGCDAVGKLVSRIVC
jgi:YD repeat-containing protein